MKTKKLNFVQRLEVAKRNLNSWQKMHAVACAYGVSDEFERKQIKQFATYIRNTCEMHGLEFSALLL